MKKSPWMLPFEKWENHSPEQYDMIYCAQAFHWLDPDVKYKKCHALLKERGYLVLFWYNANDDHSPEGQALHDRIDGIVSRYVSKHHVKNESSQRLKHDGINKVDERLKEIEGSGLFALVEKTEYLVKTKNDAEGYWKAMKSVPAFASILDGMDGMIIESMEKEIKVAIDEFGGYVNSFLNFSLYITQKRTK